MKSFVLGLIVLMGRFCVDCFCSFDWFSFVSILILCLCCSALAFSIISSSRLYVDSQRTCYFSYLHIHISTYPHIYIHLHRDEL